MERSLGGKNWNGVDRKGGFESGIGSRAGLERNYLGLVFEVNISGLGVGLLVTGELSAMPSFSYNFFSCRSKFVAL